MMDMFKEVGIIDLFTGEERSGEELSKKMTHLIEMKL